MRKIELRTPPFTCPPADTAAMLLKFCELNHCAMLTPEERNALAAADANTLRLLGHLDKFRGGLARRNLQAAQRAYIDDPSDANRSALDKHPVNWILTEEANGMQRSLIEKVLTQHCGQSLKGILSGTLRRAAAALSMMAEQVRTQEQAQHLDYNAPYRTSHIVDSLTERAGMLWRTVEKIESEGWYWNAPSHSVPDCEWLPAVAKIEGPLFKVEAAPVAATAPEKIKPDAAAPAKRPDIAVVTLEEARRSRSMQRRPIATVAAMAAFQPFESALRGAAERAGNSGHQV